MWRLQTAMKSIKNMKHKKEMNKTKVKQKQKIDTYSGYDLCQNCYHKREIHLGVCMLENDKQFPCDCIEFKEKKDKRTYTKI
jgi:hypothetical protein